MWLPPNISIRVAESIVSPSYASSVATCVQDHLIAKASATKDRLFVLSCSLKAFDVPFDAVKALKAMPLDERDPPMMLASERL